MTQVGQEIIVPGIGKCTVTEVVTLKSGKVRLSYRTPKNKIEMMMEAALPAPIEFAPAKPWGELVADYRKDNLRRRQIMNIA